MPFNFSFWFNSPYISFPLPRRPSEAILLNFKRSRLSDFIKDRESPFVRCNKCPTFRWDVVKVDTLNLPRRSCYFILFLIINATLSSDARSFHVGQKAMRNSLIWKEFIPKQEQRCWGGWGRLITTAGRICWRRTTTANSVKKRNVFVKADRTWMILMSGWRLVTAVTSHQFFCLSFFPSVRP